MVRHAQQGHEDRSRAAYMREHCQPASRFKRLKCRPGIFGDWVTTRQTSVRK